MDNYIERILSARVYDVAIETPLEHAPTLSKRLGNEILLKREDMQSVFSFKCRGAYNKIFNTLKKQPDLQGVIAASAGNHAQGVAQAAAKLGIKSIIVMPRTTPQIKVNAVKMLGGKAVLFGDTYDDAYAHARQLEAEKGYSFIHPFDDPDTIAGQGTIGLELCRQHPDDIHAIFIPIGGGGLAAGIAVFMKYLKPETRIIGVEPTDANAMNRSLAAGRRITLDQVGLFADGVAVKKVGKNCFDLCQQYVDDIIEVNVDETCAAIKDIFEDTRTLMEPAGAISVAGIKKYVEKNNLQKQQLIAITSGANVNFDRLRHIAERAEIGENREALLMAAIPERVGSFRQFCQALGKRNITEFNYRFANNGEAHIFTGVQLRGEPDELPDLLKQLEHKGYAVTDLTGDEMSKLHVRYMVGGRATGVSDERLFRFEFPERPGALAVFLNTLGRMWNISLFHYRNHGAAYGRVLAGIQVPAEESSAFEASLKQLGYAYWEETQNPAYQALLR